MTAGLFSLYCGCTRAPGRDSGQDARAWPWPTAWGTERPRDDGARSGENCPEGGRDISAGATPTYRARNRGRRTDCMGDCRRRRDTIHGCPPATPIWMYGELTGRAPRCKILHARRRTTMLDQQRTWTRFFRDGWNRHDVPDVLMTFHVETIASFESTAGPPRSAARVTRGRGARVARGVRPGVSKDVPRCPRFADARQLRSAGQPRASSEWNLPGARTADGKEGRGSTACDVFTFADDKIAVKKLVLQENRDGVTVGRCPQIRPCVRWSILKRGRSPRPARKTGNARAKGGRRSRPVVLETARAGQPRAERAGARSGCTRERSGRRPS